MTYVRDDVKNLLGMLAAMEGPQMHEVDPETGRQMYLQTGAVAERPAPADVTTANLAIPGPAGVIKARSYRPANAAADGPTIVFFHGGGWVIGDLDTHDVLCRELCNASGCAVVAVDYRMGPEVRFPGAVNDVLAATRWVASQAKQLRIDSTRLAVGGGARMAEGVATTAPGACAPGG